MGSILKKLLLEFEDKNRGEIFQKFMKVVFIFAGGFLCLWVVFWLVYRPEWGYPGGGMSIRDPFSGFQYYIDNTGIGVSVINVIHSGPIKDGCLEIPESFWGRPVVGVDLAGLENLGPVTSVKIPDSVIYIDGLRIKTLQKVTGGYNVREIATYAFWQCEALTKVELGNKIEEVGSYAFENCISLEEIRFGNYLKRIDTAAFYGCENLKAVDLGDNLPVIIDKDAFSGTPWLDTDEAKKIMEKQE